MTDRHYELIDKSERQHIETLDVADFADCPELGRDAEVTILVKWTNQSYHDENLRAMFTPDWDAVAGISRTNTWRHRNQYYGGLIVQASLGADYLDSASAHLAVTALQPTGVDSRSDGTTAFACADKLLFAPDDNPAHTTKTVADPAFARLHAVEFSPSEQRLLTASSSLDLLHELDTQGNIIWTFDAWQDTPYNTNQLGQQFVRRASMAAGRAVLSNPDPIELKDDKNLRGAICVIDDPEAYNNLGLPTNLTPVFINGASYAPDGQILTTSFHRGEAWTINRTSHQITAIAKNMGSPHGLQYNPDTHGYLVSDTLHERARFIDPDLEREVSMDLSALGDRKAGLERVKWLQYTTRLAANLYCAVVAPRQRVTLFDPVHRLRRDIPFDHEWGIQLIKTRRNGSG